MSLARAASPSIADEDATATSEVAHTTTPPLKSLDPAANTVSRSHPVRHAAPSSGPQATAAAANSAPDTSGQGGAAPSRIPSTSANFTGIGNLDGVLPPDSQGAAGPTQYMEIVNTHLAVFSKAGVPLVAPKPTNTLWSRLGSANACAANNDGDAMILYDAMSDRWVAQQFSVSTTPYLECVAVSASNDATGPWHAYAFRTPGQDRAGNGFPDYPKMGIWRDGYYITFNLFNQPGTAGQGSRVCAYERARMIEGRSASQQCHKVIGPHPAPRDDDTVLPASVEGNTPPPAGSGEYLLSAPQTAGSQRTLNAWTYDVDWRKPANTTLSARMSISVHAYTMPCFNSHTGIRDCVPQGGSGQKLDALGDRLMSRLGYRNRGGHQSLVVDHNIVAGQSIGMRWYELAPSGRGLRIIQQGTVAPGPSYRWMGSVAQDKSGDIAMGYSLSSRTVAPQIRYSGRLAGDRAGTMPQGEGVVALPSNHAQTIGGRWGDYTSMTVDPTDGCTFWYVNEFGLPSGDWSTQISSFRFPTCH